MYFNSSLAEMVGRVTRGCGQEYYYHIPDQRVLCCTRMSPLSSVCSSRSLSLQVQHVVPEVTIPPEVTPENVTTYIVDSGGA